MILRNLDLPRLYDPFLIANRGYRDSVAYIGRIKEILSWRFPSSRGIIFDNFQLLLSIVLVSLIIFPAYVRLHCASFKIYPDNIAAYTPTFAADEN